AGYRVYRTAAAGDGVDTVSLLAEVAEPMFVDDGSAEPGDETPMPPGSLGVWHTAGALNTPRAASAVLTAPAGGGDTFLYAFGGRDAGGAPLATYEVSRVTEVGGVPMVAPFIVGADRLGTARSELGGWVLSGDDTAAIPAGETWIFVGPGRTAGNFSRAVEAGPVGPDGQLGAVIATDSVNSDSAGYGYGAANGFLFVFGSRNGQPDDSGISGELCVGVCGGGPPEPPDLRNWNNLGVRLTTPRAYMGSTQESAFFFVVGGMGQGGPLTSTEQTVQ
ncbi:MAG: hypothetical protein KC620_21075, partial [Myxococcales bacterium]|nr:hypothetical protein [Myxococcales bacterium]